MSFYAVRVGKNPGIYTSWDECKKQVIGVKGSIYKKFNSKSCAEAFYKNKSKYYKKTKNTTTKKTKKTQKKQIIKIDHTLYIFTDGSSTNNGSKNSIAGYGVYIPEPTEIKIAMSRKLPKGTTNNSAELKAILEALKLIKHMNLSTLNITNTIIVTDSEYAINCITKWCHKWIKQNWKSLSGNDVKNKELIQEIYPLYKKYKISFKHINSHTGKAGFFYEGNRIADELASGIINTK
jgi:ribonuclease HI